MSRKPDKWETIDGEPYLIEETFEGRLGNLRLLVDPEDNLTIRVSGEVKADVGDIDNLIGALTEKIRDIRSRFERGFHPDPIGFEGFGRRWEVMGDSRSGGWTVAQEQVLAGLWGRAPLAAISKKIMMQREFEMQQGIHRSIKTLGARGVIFRAEEMGLISPQQARSYAGPRNSQQQWPRYGEAKEPVA